MQETEADTRANRIDPVLRDAGWGVVDGSRVAREEIAKGRITTAGRMTRKGVTRKGVRHVFEFRFPDFSGRSS